MERKELVNKINKQAGYADAVDAYRICDVYTELFGVKFFDTQKNPMDIKDQLIIMWDKIVNYGEVIESDYYYTNELCKACNKCGIIKPLNEYHKRARNKIDGHNLDCKVCAIKTNNEWVKKKLLQDPDYLENRKLKYKK